MLPILPVAQEVCEFLLGKGADPNVKNAEGNTPANEADEEEVMELLRKATAGEA